MRIAISVNVRYGLIRTATMQLVKGALVNAIRLKDEASLASGEKMIQEVSLRIVVYWKVESDAEGGRYPEMTAMRLWPQ